MKAVAIAYIDEIAALSKGIDILSGTTTANLYVPILDFPVLDCNNDTVVGHFTFDPESELIVFRPTKP